MKALQEFDGDVGRAMEDLLGRGFDVGQVLKSVISSIYHILFLV